MIRHPGWWWFCGLALVLLPASSCRQQGRATEPEGRAAAIGRLERELLDRPENERVRQDLTLLLLQEGAQAEEAGDARRAVDRYRRALSFSPGHEYARLALGRRLLLLGDHKRAIAEMETLMRANPRYSAELYRLLAAAYLEDQRPADARESLLQSRAMDPVNLETLRALARVYRQEGNLEAAARQESAADAVVRFGYPDRGYREKTLEEWSMQSLASGPGMAEVLAGGSTCPGKAPEGPRSKNHDPGAALKARALYNLATYLDRALDDRDLAAYEKVMRAWQTYLSLARGLPEEKPYHKAIKEHVSALKKRRKDLARELGVMGLEEVKGKSRNIIESLKKIPAGLAQARESAAKAGDRETEERAQNLMDRLVALDLMGLIDRLRAVNHQVQELAARRQRNAPEVTAELIRSEARRLGDEVKAVGEILERSGIEKLRAEAEAITGKYRVQAPKLGGEGGGSE